MDHDSNSSGHTLVWSDPNVLISLTRIAFAALILMTVQLKADPAQAETSKGFDHRFD